MRNDLQATIQTIGFSIPEWVFVMTFWTGIVLALAALADLALRRRVAAKWRVLLYVAVLVRVLLPAKLDSPVGLGFDSGRPAVTSTELHYEDLRARGLPAPPPYVRQPPAIDPQLWWPPLWVAAWALGVLVLGGSAVLSRLRLAHAARRASPRPEGYAEHPTVGPAVVGLLRPRIVLPSALLATRSADDVDRILRHERAHVRRLDPLFAALAQAVTILAWPVVPCWLALARLRALMEQACDDAALRGHGDSERREYARTLVETATLAAPVRTFAPAGLAFGASLDSRVRALRRGGGRWHALAQALAVPVAVLLVGLAGTRTIEADPATARAATTAPTAQVAPLPDPAAVTGADIVRAHADAANGVTFEIREVAPGKLNVQGTAPSPLVLSAFLRALADDPRVGEVAMGKVTAKEAHVAFEILVTMQPTSGLVDRLVLPLLPPTSKLRSITRRDFDGPMPQYAAHIQMPLESTLGSDPSLRLVEVDVARNGDGSDQLWVFDLARIATIHVAGNTTLSQVEILSRLPIVPGDVFDDATLERVRWPSWQQGLFDAVSVTTGPALADGVALIVEVHESKAASRLPLPEAPAIVVRADEGTEVRTARSPQWAPVAAGAALETGDRVRTDGGYAIVQHPRGRTRIQLGPGELVEIDRGGFQSIRVSGDGARPGDEPTALDPLNDVEIAWHLTQEPLRKAIQIINGLANVDVDVDPSLDVDRLVDWNTPTIPLTEALDVLARGSGLEVRIVGPRRIAIASAAAAGGDSFLAKFCIAEVRPDELLRRAGLPGQWAPAVGTRVTMTSGADALVAELEASGALQVISRPLVMVRRGETAEIESGEEGAERLKLTFVVDGSEDPRVLDGTITWAGKPAKFQVPADASTSAVFLGARERGRHLVAIVTVYRQR